MPTKLNIPARTEHHCEPCIHLKRANMICSRLHGISCDYVCKHPNAYTQASPIMMTHGRMIGRDDIQPEWCPLKAKESDAKDTQ